MPNSTDMWTFKHEPKKLEQMALHPDVRKRLTKAMKDVPNLLLYGKPGVGKGTFTHIFLKETGYDYLWINASDETGIDTIRDKVKSFATSLGVTPLKIVVLNECLDENEEIMLSNNSFKRLKDISLDEKINIISYNMDKDCLENDTANIISDKEDIIYLVELEDGREIKTTAKHPFLIKNNDGKIITKMLSELNEGDEIISL